MPDIYFKSVPFSKEDVTLALESGVDGIITEAEHVEGVRSLALCDVRAEADMPSVGLGSKAEEESIASRIAGGERLVLAQGWEIIPVENLLAQPAVAGKLAVEVASLAEARLAAGVLECGVPVVVVLPEALASLKNIVSELKLSQGTLTLDKATITEVKTVGLGHRVCVDTLTLMERGQGMLVGNSSAFTFLTHAETEHNEYVAARPFRINAGGVHAYAVMPGDKTCYVGELRSGDEVLIVDKDFVPGAQFAHVAGLVAGHHRIGVHAARVDAERPRTGSVFLQNAETIRLVRPDGTPVSVVALRPGDEVICRADVAGRHFGMRIQENIREI
ncbi:3-dehydroquinate synthase II [Bilophila wadsworthia]|uniref:3-dehydroquinate synthase II n=1 Tax=Bilophila wadsworthia TaxID=35833 RepID=UPI0028E45BEA|nr:3-dehydroquinate synthase II [Bilophila wadsworthia]